MRCIAAALIWLIAVGELQARALPGDDVALNRRAAELDYTHLSDYPLDDVRNDGLAQRSSDVIVSLPEDHALNDIPKHRLAMRVAVGGIPPPPPPKPAPPHGPGIGKPGTRPRTGRPNANEEPEDAAMAIERAGLSDTSDIVKVTPCKAAKRGLKNIEMISTLSSRMSGDEKALTWSEWQDVFDQVDQKIAALNGKSLLKHPMIRVIFMGGISGIVFNSRGEDGRTGDADISFDTSTPTYLREFFLKAVDRMVAKNPGKFETIENIGKPDPINDQWDKHASESAKASLTRESKMVAWEGKYFTAVHGDWKMQLLSKMKRISEWRTRSGEFKEKDQLDARLFLQKVRELVGNGQQLDIGHFESWGSLLGWDPEQTGAWVRTSLKIVAGDDMAGISQELKNAVNRLGC